MATTPNHTDNYTERMEALKNKIRRPIDLIKQAHTMMKVVEANASNAQVVIVAMRAYMDIMKELDEVLATTVEELDKLE